MNPQMEGRVKVEVSETFWAAVALAFALALIAMSRMQGGHTDAGVVLAAATVPLALMAATFLHELGHALSAADAGVPVRRIRLTGIGGAAVLERPCATPRAQLRVALAGPVVNLTLFLAAAMVARSSFGWDVGDVTTGLFARGRTTLPETVVFFVLVINATLALFNLLPGAPLDGGRAVQAVWWRATGDPWRGWQVAAALGVVTGGALIGVAVAAVLRPGDPVLAALVAANGAMVLVPAWRACGPFAACRRLQSTRLVDHLGPPEATLRDGQSLAEAHDDVFVHWPESCHHPLLDDEGRLLGLVHRPMLRAALARGRHEEPLTEVLALPARDPVLVVCAADATVGSVLAERHLEDASELAAVDADGRLLGIATWEAVQARGR